MNFYFFNEHEGVKEIIINDDSIIFKCNKSSLESKEIVINYLDIKTLELHRFKEVFFVVYKNKRNVS